MAKCPACGKPGEVRFAPFCSSRCQQVDLGRWLKGDYVIPGRHSEIGAEPGDSAPAPDGQKDED